MERSISTIRRLFIAKQDMSVDTEYVQPIIEGSPLVSVKFIRSVHANIQYEENSDEYMFQHLANYVSFSNNQL